MNFLIVGIVRNCEKTIKPTIKSLSRAFDFAERIQYYFVESDSTDDSLKILKELSEQNNNFNFETCGNLTNKGMRTRCVRTSFCRNKYLDYLRLNKNAWAKYLVIVDVDGVFRGVDSKVIQEFINKDDWAVMAANVKGNYYDIWALREDTWSPNDCWMASRNSLKNGLTQYQSEIINVYSRMIKIKKGKNLISVKSAFGGFAIYNTSRIPKDACYSGIYDNGEEKVDHLDFNLSIYNSNPGKFFINPNLIIGPSPYEHTKFAGIIGLNRFWLKMHLFDPFLRFISRKKRSLFRSN